MRISDWSSDVCSSDLVDGGGWFDTGDIAVVHPDAVMQITDRATDVIKSGGEWISSIAIEEAAASHAHVEACAVIGIAHEKWGERSEEHTSELQSLMRSSYAVFCLKKKTNKQHTLQNRKK